MKIKTQDLTGRALNWAVSIAHRDGGLSPVEYSTDWSHGGPIIERQRISVASIGPHWQASMPVTEYEGEQDGPTPLIAAMRCYVASRLGDEVDVPEGVVA